MKYTIRIAALAVIMPALVVTYSDLLESDKERLVEAASVKVMEAEIGQDLDKSVAFSYREILMNAEVVVVPIPEYASTPKDPSKQYNKLIQVASFKTKQRADKLKDQLLKKQMPNVQLVKSSNSDWYSITVGPFVSRSMLNKAQDQLVQMGYVTQILSVNL